MLTDRISALCIFPCDLFFFHLSFLFFSLVIIFQTAHSLPCHRKSPNLVIPPLVQPPLSTLFVLDTFFSVFIRNYDSPHFPEAPTVPLNTAADHLCSFCNFPMQPSFLLCFCTYSDALNPFLTLSFSSPNPSKTFLFCWLFILFLPKIYLIDKSQSLLFISPSFNIYFQNKTIPVVFGFMRLILWKSHEWFSRSFLSHFVVLPMFSWVYTEHWASKETYHFLIQSNTH